MSRDALIDGHGCCAVGVDLCVFRAQQAQTVRRRAAGQICLQRCASEVRICCGGHAEHGIVRGHARRDIERELLEICDALRRDALRLTYDERVVRTGDVRCLGVSAVELRPAEIGGARDLDCVAAHDRRRILRTVRHRTTTVDRTLVAAAVQIHLVALCRGGRCAACGEGVAVAAVNILFKLPAAQPNDVRACGCLCLRVRPDRTRLAAADLLPWGTHGAERNAVRVCRCCDRAQPAQCTRNPARDIASVAVASCGHGDRILLCCCCPAVGRVIRICSAAGEIPADCARPVLDRDAVAYREGGRRVRPCVRCAVARCHPGMIQARACERDRIALDMRLRRVLRGIDVGSAHQCSVVERTARSRDVIVHRVNADIARSVRGERGTCDSHAICCAAVVDGDGVLVHLGGNRGGIVCSGLLDARTAEIADLHAVRADDDGVVIRRIGGSTALYHCNTDLCAVEMRCFPLGERHSVPVRCEPRCTRDRSVRIALVVDMGAREVKALVCRCDIQRIAARRCRAISVGMTQLCLSGVYGSVRGGIRDRDRMVVLDDRLRIRHSSAECQPRCNQRTKTPPRICSMISHNIDSFCSGSTDKFSRAILTHLFCPHCVGKSST